MAKFRKKPVVIEAQKLGDHWEGETFWDAVCTNEIVLHEDGSATIQTLEGDMEASCGDWIIRGVNGEFYLCKPDIFEKTYEQLIEARDIEAPRPSITALLDGSMVAVPSRIAVLAQRIIDEHSDFLAEMERRLPVGHGNDIEE